MPTNSVLIKFIGYPASVRALLPDNGLANLAASLISKGHKTKIFDYATVDMIETLYPYQLKDTIENVKLMAKSNQQLLTDSKFLVYVQKVNSEIEKYQLRKIDGIVNELIEYIIENKVDFIGMKLITGTGFKYSMYIAQQLKKKFPEIPVFAGGPHIDWFMEKIYDVTDVFDVLAYAEGEEAIVMLAEFAEGKRKLDEIPNLIYKKNGKTVITQLKIIENLNNIPYPVYDTETYPAMKNNNKIKIIMIDESRGCPNKCAFCIHPIKSGNKWRTVEAARIVDIIKHLKNSAGTKIFRFAGSNPPPSLRRKIGSELIKQKVEIEYTAFCHINGINESDIALIKQSGCYSLAFGIESGSEVILNESLNKRNRIGLIKRNLQICKKSGIIINVSMIIPAPNETEQTKLESLNLLLSVKPDSAVVFPPGLIFNTEWDKKRRKYGFEIKDDKTFFQKEMFYDRNPFFPVDLWDSFSEYRLNDKTLPVLLKETGLFIRELEKNGILTDIFDEELLIAKYSGLSPVEFRNKTAFYFSSGDYTELNKLVNEINHGIMH